MMKGSKAVKVAEASNKKGKDKQRPMKPVDKVIEDEESEWSSEDEDEDNGGVSQKGMERLMKLVNVDDLDEEEKNILAQESEDEDEEDDEDKDEDFDEELDGSEDEDEDEDDSEDEELDDEEDSESEDDEEVEDTVKSKLDNSILVEEADPDTVAMDDIDSNASVDEDAVPMRKLMMNNKPALRAMTDSLKVTNLPWPETLVLSSKEKVEVDASDDLQRETAFYRIALEQVPIAKKLAAKYDIPFSRPLDYFAEMVKSDEHMERIRTKLVEETQGIKKSEAAKKQRDLKKYGKQIQVEKLKQREMDKRSFSDKMQGVKRKRKEGMDLGEEDDEFGIEIDDGPDERRGGSKNDRQGGRDKPKMPRHARDSKYSLGGGGRRSKQNTKESTSDFAGWGANKGKGGGKAGGQGGSRRKGRPGKSKRAAGRR